MLFPFEEAGLFDGLGCSCYDCKCVYGGPRHAPNTYLFQYLIFLNYCDLCGLSPWPFPIIFIFNHNNQFILNLMTIVCHFFIKLITVMKTNFIHTTLNNGYLGSRHDEERSEMRYVMRIAEFSESSNL